MHDAGLGHGVARVRHHAQARFGPDADEIECGLYRRHHVVAAMYNYAGNGAEPMRIGDQVVVGGEEAVIDEVVTLDACESERIGIL